jgi:ABC-type Na+ transport system ATPase subunit NatA
MAIGGKKHHKSEVASSISSEALLSRLQEEALAAEQESLHMQKTEADVFKRIEKEEDELKKLLEKEIERNKKAAELSKAKIQQAKSAQAIFKRKLELKLRELNNGLNK